MSELSEVVIDECTEKMHKAIEHLRDEFGAIRTGRATPSLVEKLMVDVYGSMVPLQQIAGITVPEPRALAVSPYDKSTSTAIERAIQQSDLGINPSNDGEVIRLAFPLLTEERRRDLVKVVKQRAEDGRVAVRNVRRQARHDLTELEGDGDLSRDELERIEKDLEKLTHEIVAGIDTMLGHKEEELLEV